MLAILWRKRERRYALNRGLILSPVVFPSRINSETDDVPSNEPHCVKPVVGFNGFPIGFGGNQGTN